MYAKQFFHVPIVKFYAWLTTSGCNKYQVWMWNEIFISLSCGPKKLIGHPTMQEFILMGDFLKNFSFWTFLTQRGPVGFIPLTLCLFQKSVEKLNVWQNGVTSYSKEHVTSKKISPQSPVTDRCPSYHWLGSAPLSSHEKPKEKVIVRECLNKTYIGYWLLANCYFRFQNAQNSRQCSNTSKKYLNKII